jgi:hypothetical protein
VIVEYDTALQALVNAALPIDCVGNFAPRADLSGTILARLRFLGFSRQSHKSTVSSVTHQWAIDLQADAALAGGTQAATMDGYIDTLIGKLLGAEMAGTFDGAQIDVWGWGAENTMRLRRLYGKTTVPDAFGTIQILVPPAK